MTFQVTPLPPARLVWNGRQALLAGIPGPFPQISVPAALGTQPCAQRPEQSRPGSQLASRRAGALQTKLLVGSPMWLESQLLIGEGGPGRGCLRAWEPSSPLSGGLVPVIGQAPQLFPGWGSRWFVGSMSVMGSFSLDRGQM